MHITDYVGERIRAIRKSKNYTQEQLGEKVGLPQPYIGGIERGERNISLETLERILEALESTPDEFFRFYNDKYFSEDERAKEEVIDSLNDLLSRISIYDIQLIQQLAYNILVTIDSHIEKR
ncbi:helix-turn-helix transcriptional regulator [Paenibacillus polymyxa]|uniref:Helix-turn-helix transcriptional regulator n=1 Tax=Paenibacillus polymyxa TaxID=1406 RepID=A0A8I1J350_PAEPO|nr:helix-turn-helix transcriptional regulator [Paenibacillus sp. EKM206P]KAF6590565.1 helix-turn-helix transcriptional regulator [Paenibacillus sp. EKM205P]MBM0632646.1 helix-turn-helix transcriptional regulator [Paenibacillus polymyxa]